jgi:hypothetical protein
LLRQLHPFLRSHKRERAALVLTHYIDAVPRNGKYTPHLNQVRSDFEKRFFAITSISPAGNPLIP